jgi:hypothetical protein
MTEYKRRVLINAIHDCMEDGCNESRELTEWELGFIDNICTEYLQRGKDLTSPQFDKLTDIIGFGWK